MIQRHQLALPTGFHIDSRPYRHHTIDLDGGLQRLHGQSDPRDEAAAPDGHHDLLYLGALVQNLQGNGPLAAHSIPVRGGVHIVQMLFFCQLTGRDEGLVICRADFHQIGPSARMLSFLTWGVDTGTTTFAWTPRFRAASAQAMP